MVPLVNGGRFEYFAEAVSDEDRYIINKIKPLQYGGGAICSHNNFIHFNKNLLQTFIFQPCGK